ncbi:MAG: thioredoxin-dependent thiol peroxidase [bacterium]
MQIGDKMPPVLGLDQNGNQIKSEDLRGEKVVLYFYPKDMTSGCTAQACSIRDGYEELRKAGYKVIGVSVDSAKRHIKFIEKNELPFDLIADENHELVNAFGVWVEKKMYGRAYMGILRTTFIFDQEGILERIIDSKAIKTATHFEQIIS